MLTFKSLLYKVLFVCTFSLWLSFTEANSNGATYDRLSLSNAAFVFLDTQVGFLGLVRDYSPEVLQNNIAAVANVASTFNVPTVICTSEGPAGPLLPQIKSLLPNATYIERNGPTNCWDVPSFVQAVKKIGRTHLVVSGIATDVVVAFTALSARKAGYQVTVVSDASGTFDVPNRYAAWSRLERRDVELMGWFAMTSELVRSTAVRAADIGAIFTKYSIPFSYLVQEYSFATQSSSSS